MFWGGSHVGGISRESLIQGGDTLVNLGREMRGCKPHRVAAEILKANTTEQRAGDAPSSRLGAGRDYILGGVSLQPRSLPGLGAARGRTEG